jgi:hypothetical protein
VRWDEISIPFPDTVRRQAKETSLKKHTRNAIGRASVVLFAVAGLATSTTVFSRELPDAVSASPEVYKIIAENDAVRVIAAAWEPGQRDAMHSHPAIGVYFLSECKNMRVHLADGRSIEWSAKSGQAGANNPVTSHAIENIGDTVCRIIFVEPK